MRGAGLAERNLESQSMADGRQMPSRSREDEFERVREERWKQGVRVNSWGQVIVA